jgi:hypothetical protein
MSEEKGFVWPQIQMKMDLDQCMDNRMRCSPKLAMTPPWHARTKAKAR